MVSTSNWIPTSALTLLASTAFAAEIELKTADRIDGFCVQNVLSMTSSRQRTPKSSPLISDDATQVLAKAEARAVNIYRDYMGPDWQIDPIIVRKSTFVKYAGDSSDHRAKTGAIVEVHTDADEDVVTFYFEKNDAGGVDLLMALHDEQSATAFWVCERQ